MLVDVFEREDGGHCYLCAKLITHPVTRQRHVEVTRWPENPQLDDIVRFGEWAKEQVGFVTVDTLMKYNIHISLTTPKEKYRRWTIDKWIDGRWVRWDGDKWIPPGPWNVDHGSMGGQRFTRHHEALHYASVNYQRLIC